MSHRLWTEPDGSIKIETFAIDTPEMRAYTASAQKADGRIDPAATFIDLTPAELNKALPKDRSQRDQWVLTKDKTGKVKVKAKGDIIASDQQVHAGDVQVADLGSVDEVTQ